MTLKLKVGDFATITKKESGHQFMIGEKVEIKRLFTYEKHETTEGSDHYEAVSLKNKSSWFVCDEELEKFEL